MSDQTSFARRLMAGASVLLIGALIAGAAAAEDKPSKTTGAGAEGTEVSDVIVTAEHGKAAATAPTKASLDQTQPEAIISHSYIEQATPEVGNWTTVVTIAPSMSGVTANGGGIGEYNKVSMRGFQDGQFNVTYDGLAFGDTNDPTHHAASYFPSSTIGAAVVDRGPGAAGDLGQENFGGAIHYFSPEVSDSFGAQQRLTYGSFDTEAAVTTLNTGKLDSLAGGKLLLDLDERWSNGELSHSGGYAYTQLLKYMLPLGDKGVLTVFSSHTTTKFYLPDAGPGETWAQVLAYGKNFQLNNIPTDEHYYKFNHEVKDTDIEYVDVKYQLTPSLSLEAQPYTYAYHNHTVAANDSTGLVGGVNTSPPNVTTSPASASDIGGYDKLNAYRVYGEVTRFAQDWSFGTLKLGGLIEAANTARHNLFEDLTLGFINDNKFTPGKKYPYLTAPTNAKLLEGSDWLQGQVFVDFNWRPIDNLTISPGFKYVDFTRSVNAANENVALNGGGFKNAPLKSKNTYTSPLYFATVNYKILPDLAVYGQFATSFLIPSLSALYIPDTTASGLKPETTTTYQTGVVYTRGVFTADADVYRVDAANLYLPCGTGVTAHYCNFGKARYTGVEGEAAYAIGFGLTVFANGSLNWAKQLASAADPAAGIAAVPAGGLPNAPRWTDAAGAIVNHGPWQGSVTYKESGAFVSSDGPKFRGYDTVDASVAYDFGHFKVKVQGFNLGDRRAITTLSSGLYQFQAGRELDLTLAAKY
jgi:iron complex outermembrane receptor protein